MQYQAKNIASGLLQNCGHNCVALEVWIGGGRGRRCGVWRLPGGAVGGDRSKVWGVEAGRWRADSVLSVHSSHRSWSPQRSAFTDVLPPSTYCP